MGNRAVQGGSTNKETEHMTKKTYSSMLEVARASSPYNKQASSNSSHSSAFETFVVERDDDRPLKFEGRLIGKNDVDEDVNNGTLVEIFVTRSGKLVTAVHQWQDAKNREAFRAAVHMMPDDALEWLKKDGGGYLGRASREAWEQACASHLPLQGQDVEVID